VEGDRYVLDQAIVEAKSRMIRRYLQEVRISVARLKSGEQEKAACAYALDKIIDTMLG
jgi:signal transduction histidine kinase